MLVACCVLGSTFALRKMSSFVDKNDIRDEKLIFSFVVVSYQSPQLIVCLLMHLAAVVRPSYKVIFKMLLVDSLPFFASQAQACSDTSFLRIFAVLSASPKS